MALYINKSKGSAIDSIDFSPVENGNIASFHIDHPEHIEEVKQKIAAMGQSIIAESNVGGKPLIVTQGNKTQDNLLDKLRAEGNDFGTPEPIKQFEPWKWRGNISNVGQTLQLMSAQFGASKASWGSTGTFAILNLMANATNLMFGGQKEDDVNRLKYLKKEFNNKLSNYLPDGVEAPDVNSHLSTVPSEKEVRESKHSSLYNFMERNSVRVGEVGLRYLASIALVVPVNPSNWKAAWNIVKEQPSIGEKLSKSTIKEASSIIVNKNPVVLYSGLAYLMGKNFALLAKAPDPYDEKPKTTWDNLREKVFFRAASVIEGGAAAVMAVNKLSQTAVDKNDQSKGFIPKLKFEDTLENGVIQKRKLSGLFPNSMKTPPFTNRDWFGGVGMGLFASGFAIRFSAPFGDRKVDMHDLNAHMAEGLARVPKDKLPQLVADTAAFVKNEFPEQEIQFGDVYAEIANNLEKNHQIAIHDPKGFGIKSPANEPEIQIAQANITKAQTHESTNNPDTKVSATNADIANMQHLSEHANSVNINEAAAIS